MKFNELVDYSILQIMLKAHKETLPINIQKRFEKRESKYNLKGTEIFKKPRLRTKLMERCFCKRNQSMEQFEPRNQRIQVKHYI